MAAIGRLGYSNTQLVAAEAYRLRPIEFAPVLDVLDAPGGMKVILSQSDTLTAVRVEIGRQPKANTFWWQIGLQNVSSQDIMPGWQARARQVVDEVVRRRGFRLVVSPMTPYPDRGDGGQSTCQGPATWGPWASQQLADFVARLGVEGVVVLSALSVLTEDKTIEDNCHENQVWARRHAVELIEKLEAKGII